MSTSKISRCTCCGGVLRTGDKYHFEGTLPYHDTCPIKLTERQREYLQRLFKGDYGVPRLTPDASMWQWAKGDKKPMNSSVVHALWDKKLIDQTYTSDSRMILTFLGKEEATKL